MRLRDVSQRLVMSGIELVIDVLVINLEELLNASPFEMQRPYGVQSVYDATVEVMRTTKLPISLFKRNKIKIFDEKCNFHLEIQQFLIDCSLFWLKYIQISFHICFKLLDGNDYRT